MPPISAQIKAMCLQMACTSPISVLSLPLLPNQLREPTPAALTCFPFHRHSRLSLPGALALALSPLDLQLDNWC